MTTQATVEMLCLTQRAPLLLRGTFEQTTETHWIFQSLQPVLFDITGLRAIISFPNSKESMLTLRIDTQQGELMTLTPIGEHPREQRQYPRLFTPINLAFHPLGEQSPEAWMQRDIQPGDDWSHPEPFMNFSVNGVAFDWHEGIEINEKLMVVFFVDQAEHRGVARVVRSMPSEADLEHHEIALYFEALETGAIDHLSALTLRLQENLL